MIKKSIAALHLKRIQLWVPTVYLVCIITTSVALGSVGPFSLPSAVLVMMAISLITLFSHPEPATGWLFKTAVVIFAGISIWVFIQSLPILPPASGNSVWTGVPGASTGARRSISIEPADTIYSLLYVALPFAAFLAGLLVNNSDERCRKTLAALGTMGAAIAYFGLMQFLLFPDILLIYKKVAYLDSLTGVFVNRNSAGTFFGLTALILARQLWSLVQNTSVIDLYRSIVHGGDFKIQSAGRLSFSFGALLGCLMALGLTQSRGAMASTLVGFAVLVVLLAMERGHAASNQTMPSISRLALRTAVGLLALLMATVIFGERSMLRVESQANEDGRFCVLPGIARTLTDHWLLGNGFGTFRYAFSPHRDADCNMLGVWERAHNIYLEGWIGLGAVFALFFLLGFVALLACHIRGLRKRQKMRSYSALGLAVIALTAAHSAIDFSLEIPGIAAYVAAILASTSSISWGLPASRSASKVVPRVDARADDSG